MTRKYSLTQSPILPLMIRYTVPLIFTNLLQVLYTIADNVIVGLSGEAEAIGAIGTTTAFINLAVNIFIGCSIGTKVLTARYIGSNDKAAVSNAVHTSMMLSVFLGVIGAVFGIIITPNVLRLMGNQGNLLTLATQYAKIYFLSLPFTAITNFSIAIIQANGDTKTPLFVLSISGLINVILNLIFVLVFKMNVDGVAIATVISTALSSLAFILYLTKRKDICRLEFKKLKIKINMLKQIMFIGMPAAIQNSLFSLSHMLVQSSVLAVNNAVVSQNSAFQPIVKGCSVCTSIESIACTVVNSIGQSAVPFIAQNSGAENYERVKKGRRIWYGVSFVSSIAVAITLILLKAPLFALYGVSNGSTDPLVRLAYDAANTRMLVMFIPYFLLGFMEVGGAVMQGLGKSFTASLTSLIGSCLFRVIWLLTVFAAKPTLEMIFISFPISWLITALAHFVFGNIEIKKRSL